MTKLIFNIIEDIPPCDEPLSSVPRDCIPVLYIPWTFSSYSLRKGGIADHSSCIHSPFIGMFDRIESQMNGT